MRRALLASLLIVMAWTPSTPAQEYSPPDPVYPLPLYSTAPADGGFFTGFTFLYWRMDNPIEHQLLAIRGFFDPTGTLTAGTPGGGMPGTFVGSGRPALYSDDLGPSNWQPGWALTLGWRFRDGLVLDATWWHLMENKYTGGATLVTPGFAGPADLADTFMSSFVYNFTTNFAGPANDVQGGTAYGIWNAASLMTIQYVQRFDQFDITGRIPLYQTENAHYYGLIGPRYVWFWERYKWITINQNLTGNFGPQDQAIYTNIFSQRMYGVHIGGGTDWRLGDTPIGSFACSLDCQGALMFNYVRNIARYELADETSGSKRSRRNWTLVPEVQANINLWWFPIEGVQCRLGYDAMLFFNTVASEWPVVYNFSSMDPEYDKGIVRLLHGLNAGIGFIF